ncbi:choice-of-anchor M domain-containing protein [Planctomycetota bacterium]
MVPKQISLVFLLAWCPALWAQGHCARVFTDVTFRFAIETPVPDGPNAPMALDLYHTDLDLSFRPSGWEVVVSRDGVVTGATGLDLLPVDALLVGNPASRWVLSSIPPTFDFIGARPGEPFWILPQNAGTGALPLGVAAERADRGRLCAWNPGDPRGADTEDLWFEMRLLQVRGPADANFAMWQTAGGSAPVVFVSTHEGGISADDVFYLSAGSHVHMNWGFTQLGFYEIDFRIATVLHCEEWLTADWVPLGGPFYNGDCQVDFRDFAHLAAQWLNIPAIDDPHDPEDNQALLLLVDQWLECGYPGCH